MTALMIASMQPFENNDIINTLIELEADIKDASGKTWAQYSIASNHNLV